MQKQSRDSTCTPMLGVRVLKIKVEGEVAVARRRRTFRVQKQSRDFIQLARRKLAEVGGRFRLGE